MKTPALPKLHAALLAHVVAEAPRASAERLRTLLQCTGVLAQDGANALAALEAVGVTIDLDLALGAARLARPAARFGTLSKYIGDAANRKAVVETLTHGDDRAWIEVLAPFRDEREVFVALVTLRDPVALEDLRAVATRDVFDLETKDACYRLGSIGDMQAATILLRWLEDPIASDSAPLLLTALAACGDGRSVATIERVRALHPSRTGFFDHAIQSIRARVGS